MKKRALHLLIPVLLFLLILTLTGCGDVSRVQRTIGVSTHYSPAVLESAMDAVERHFHRHFDGCTLTELTYDEEYSDKFAAEWAEQYGARYAVVLLSSFDVDASGGDGSLNPNSTYKRWEWILTCSVPGIWTLQTWGYC